MKNRSMKPKTWSRKGRCPKCFVGTGSRHSTTCDYDYEVIDKAMKRASQLAELSLLLEADIYTKNKVTYDR